MTDHHPRARARLRLGLLIAIHIVISCLSLVYVAASSYPNAFNPAEFHIFHDPSRWYVAVAAVAAFALVSCLFLLCDFSIGYFIGFYLYTMVLGYLWLNCFTDLNYDHVSAGLSAAASAVALLLPALFIASPIRQTFVLSASAFDRLSTSILLLAAAVIAVGATYNFRLVGVENIYDFRDKLEFPTLLNYMIGTVSGALLPFAFAGFVARRAYWRAGAVLLLSLLFYPITLSKIALFMPCWLVGVWLLSKLFEARTSIVLSLLIPILAGLVLITVFGNHAVLYFATINFRMIAIPSVGLDVYNDFFSRHDLTYFCQISPLKLIMHCPYRDPLGAVMKAQYRLGFFNASLFATEGIASVGILWAPVSALACGLVIALGNRLSRGLPPVFILVSGAMLPLTLLNVPLTTVLLTHGAGLLFLLWYITPRGIFEQGGGTATSCTKVRSESGDPVQLSDLHPVACESLVRLGSPHDGGYVVPLVAVDAAGALVSFGLSHNWSFERDFKRRNPAAIVHCYDHTLSLRTALQYSIGQLLRFAVLFRIAALREIFTWVDYKQFFRSGATHFRQRIWSDNSGGSATIGDAFGRLPPQCPVFVKMDIEGSEYLVLEDLLRHCNNVVAMAIEFHDVDVDPDRFNAAVARIKQDFYIVHIHGNNLGGTTPFSFPVAPEMTFLSKRFFPSPPPPSRLTYPVAGLDRPNHPRFPEFTFEF